MIKVLIVDDSALVRTTIAQQLSQCADIEVVGTAVDPYMAREKIVAHKPDVLTLDVEMPRMNGLSFLAKLMRHYPMPVVILSALTPQNSENAMKALSLGAIEVISKPGSRNGATEVNRRLIRAIRAAASADIASKECITNTTNDSEPIINIPTKTPYKVVAIGASTGGTRAIETLLSELPVATPATLIVQHMPQYISSAFAQRLDAKCAMEVREANDSDVVKPGLALIAPGDKHMLLQRSGRILSVKVKEGPPVHYQRPSVDVLFHSVAANVGRQAIGVILTGMGADGASGLAAMRDRGAFTIAQNEESCSVFGMPKKAIKLGAAEKIVSLPDIANTVITALHTPQENCII